MSESTANISWALRLTDQDATEFLAQLIAEDTQPGDLITLSGDLGAGKTTFARAFVRAFARDPEMEVPSPTFTLMQTYEVERGTIVHADFYRISDPSELDYLGWDEAIENAVALVEWPDRAEGYLSENRLEVNLRLVPGFEGERVAVLTATGNRAPRLAMLKGVRTVLDRAGWGNAQRTPMYGDASTRLYERLTRPDGQTAVLMYSPPRPTTAAYGSARPYHVVARLADSIHAFVAVDRGLRALELSAPVIYAHDLDVGLMVLEDLGSDSFVNEAGPIPERYAEAVKVLAKLHASNLPRVLPVVEGMDYKIPPYDIDALMAEVELMLEWYLPHKAGRFVPNAGREEFRQLWARVLNPLTPEHLGDRQLTWALRDFHSPNLIWLKEREGLARVGLIDFQDAVMSHPAYDLASLLQDARVTVSPELELKLLALYAKERCARDPSFDVEGLTCAYAVMGAQRATKILGVFVRLDKRDGKPAYLAHLPRVGEYLQRNLAHPVLTGLREWYYTHLPQLIRGEMQLPNFNGKSAE